MPNTRFSIEKTLGDVCFTCLFIHKYPNAHFYNSRYDKTICFHDRWEKEICQILLSPECLKLCRIFSDTLSTGQQDVKSWNGTDEQNAREMAIALASPENKNGRISHTRSSAVIQNGFPSWTKFELFSKACPTKLLTPLWRQRALWRRNCSLYVIPLIREAKR